MPWYSETITPPIEERTPTVTERAARRNATAGTSTAAQETFLAQVIKSTTSIIATASNFGSGMHQQSGYPADGGSAYTSWHLLIVHLAPSFGGSLNSPPADMMGADSIEYDSDGYVVDFEVTLSAVGSDTFSSVSPDESFAQQGTGDGTLCWDTDFDFTFETDSGSPANSYYYFPGTAWRAWDNVDVTSGATVEQTVTLAPGGHVAALVAPDWARTPVYPPPDDQPAIPSRISQYLDLSHEVVARIQPNSYRLVYNDDNPPPWLRTGIPPLRHRQGVTGGGPPSRHRQNGNYGGGPLSRHRQTGL